MQAPKKNFPIEIILLFLLLASILIVLFGNWKGVKNKTQFSPKILQQLDMPIQNYQIENALIDQTADLKLTNQNINKLEDIAGDFYQNYIQFVSQQSSVFNKENIEQNWNEYDRCRQDFDNQRTAYQDLKNLDIDLAQTHQDSEYQDLLEKEKLYTFQINKAQEEYRMKKQAIQNQMEHLNNYGGENNYIQNINEEKTKKQSNLQDLKQSYQQTSDQMRSIESILIEVNQNIKKKSEELQEIHHKFQLLDYFSKVLSNFDDNLTIQDYLLSIYSSIDERKQNLVILQKLENDPNKDKEVKKVQVQLEKFQQQVKDLQEKYQEFLLKFQTQNNDLNKGEINKMAQSHKLKLEQLQQDVALLQSEHTQIKIKIQEQKQSLEDNMKNQSKLISEISKLEVEYDSSQENFETSKNKLQELQNDLQDLEKSNNQSITNLNLEMKQIKQKIEDKDKELNLMRKTKNEELNKLQEQRNKLVNVLQFCYNKRQYFQLLLKQQQKSENFGRQLSEIVQLKTMLLQNLNGLYPETVFNQIETQYQGQLKLIENEDL